MKRLAATLVLAVLPYTASANDFVTGRRLLQWLETNELITARGNRGTADEGFDAGMGSGYIAGIHDTVAGTVLCLPRGTPVRRLIELSVQWLRAHPDRLTESADVLVVEATRAVYPCTKPNSYFNRGDDPHHTEGS